MKYRLKEVLMLQRMISLLSKGIDPVTMTNFNDSSVLKKDIVKDSLISIVEIIGVYIEQNYGYRVNRRKIAFSLTSEQMRQVHTSDEPITISKFTYILNQLCESEKMAKIKATDITNWLVLNGYLKIENTSEEVTYKVATEKGIEIGITTEIRENTNNIRYAYNCYSKSAQEYLLSNINDISLGVR